MDAGPSTIGTSPARTSRLRSLAVIVTSDCNLRCAYCYEDAKRAGRIEWSTIRAALDVLRATGRPQVDIEFTGGEPLLHFPLIERAFQYFEERRGALRARYCVLTNGLLLDESKAAFLAERGFHLKLSFDGVAAAQDLRGAATFPRLDRLLSRLSESHRDLYAHRLIVAVTVPVASIRRLGDSIEYLLTKHVRSIEVNPATGQAGWDEVAGDDLARQFERIVAASLRHYDSTGRVPVLWLRKRGLNAFDRVPGEAVCGALSGETLAVDTDGQAYPCALFARSAQTFARPSIQQAVAAMQLGDIRDAGLPDRLAGLQSRARACAIFESKAAKHTASGRCSACRFLPQCFICPMATAHEPADWDDDRLPESLCAFNRTALACRERFPATLF